MGLFVNATVKLKWDDRMVTLRAYLPNRDAINMRGGLILAIESKQFILRRDCRGV